MMTETEWQTMFNDVTHDQDVINVFTSDSWNESSVHSIYERMLQLSDVVRVKTWTSLVGSVKTFKTQHECICNPDEGMLRLKMLSVTDKSNLTDAECNMLPVSLVIESVRRLGHPALNA